jgi:hypothetical protein
MTFFISSLVHEGLHFSKGLKANGGSDFQNNKQKGDNFIFIIWIPYLK